MAFVEDPELERWKRTHRFPPEEEGASQEYWRWSARVIIDQILVDTKGQEAKDRIKAIDKLYPFGERKGAPYHCWLIERRGAMIELGLLKKEHVND